jgi:hypothetical protein
MANPLTELCETLRHVLTERSDMDLADVDQREVVVDDLQRVLSNWIDDVGWIVVSEGGDLVSYEMLFARVEAAIDAHPAIVRDEQRSPAIEVSRGPTFHVTAFARLRNSRTALPDRIDENGARAYCRSISYSAKYTAALVAAVAATGELVQHLDDAAWHDYNVARREGRALSVVDALAAIVASGGDCHR